MKANKLQLPIDIQCNLVETLVFPNMLYGCEIWGLKLRLCWKYLHLLNKEESTLAHIVYMITHNLFVRNVYKAKWLCRVKNIVDHCGLSYLWLSQSMIDTHQAKQLIHTRIEDVAFHNWYIYIPI